MAKLSVHEGGCWFCKQDDEHEPLYPEREFDTFVHLTCLKQALKDPDNEEANIMASNFKELLEEN